MPTNKENPEEHQERMNLVARNIVFRQDTFNEEKRTVQAVMATESRVRVFDFLNWEIIEEILLFKGLELPEQVPLQDSHMRSTLKDTLGSNRTLRIEGDEAVAEVFFATTTEGERAYILYRDKHLNTFSIGYMIDRAKAVTIRAGEKAIVDGIEYTASQNMALRVVPGDAWTLVENSAVAIPADGRAKTRNENIKPDLEERKMKYDADFVRSLGYDMDSYSEADEKWCREQFAVALARHEGKTPEAKEEPKIEEGKRSEPVVPAISVAEEVKRELAAAKAVRSELVKECEGLRLSEGIRDKVLECETVDAGRKILLEETRSSRTNVGSPAIHVIDNEATIKRLQAGFGLRTGLNQEDLGGIRGLSEQDLDEGSRYKHTSLVDLCRMSHQIDGREAPLDRDDMIRSAFTTISLPKILGLVANKRMLKGYTYASSTWEAWTSQNDVSDFKLNTGVRATDTGELEEVFENGEVADGGMTEEFETYKIARYAKKFGVGEINIINDDLSFLQKTPQNLGNKAGQLVAKLAYTALMDSATLSDGNALFDNTNHSNFETSQALNSANLSASKAIFGKQTDLDGNTINNRAKFLIAPVELEGTVLPILKSKQLITGEDAAAIGDFNVHQNTLTPIFDSRLSDANFTNQSATTWYLAADPNMADTIQVSFLAGSGRVPKMTTHDGGVDYIGIWWRVVMDTGAKALDFRGLQKNTA